MNRFLGTAIFLLLGINFFRQALVILDIQVTAYRPRKKRWTTGLALLGLLLGFILPLPFFERLLLWQASILVKLSAYTSGLGIIAFYSDQTERRFAVLVGQGHLYEEIRLLQLQTFEEPYLELTLMTSRATVRQVYLSRDLPDIKAFLHEKGFDL